MVRIRGAKDTPERRIVAHFLLFLAPIFCSRHTYPVTAREYRGRIQETQYLIPKLTEGLLSQISYQ
jgi:hypothetical protein